MRLTSALAAGLAAFGFPFMIGALDEWRAGWAPAAEAHVARSGWAYPLECCSDHDCYEIDPSDLAAVPGGWQVKATGETIPTASLRPSPDGRYHRCSLGADRQARTLCLFVPPMGA